MQALAVSNSRGKLSYNNENESYLPIHKEILGFDLQQ